MLFAAVWISTDLVRLGIGYSRWSPQRLMTLYVQSIPAVLFAAILYWWYSKPSAELRK